MESYLALILVLLLASFSADVIADLLNVRHADPRLPDEFRGLYDPEKYQTSQRYLRDTTRFSITAGTVSLALTIALIVFGGFNVVDRLARGFGLSEIPTGLIFGAALALLGWAARLPFSLYGTFVLEERYGFNRTTARTYASDTVKGALLGAAFGAPLFAGLQYFFLRTGERAWLYAWAAFTAFQLVMMFLAPVLIMPLFNKFTPLAEGALRQAIEAFARSQRFHVSGIFTMDGSRRSSKANAFFTGFGRFRRIVFFDTLLGKQTDEEIVAVLAHEIGHYKRKHIVKSAVLSIGGTGAMFWVLSRFLNNPGLFAAFRMEQPSIYASFVFVSLLFSPIMGFLSVFTNMLSRRFEFEADEYAAREYGRPAALVSALKKLSIENMSNLTPHWFKVLLDYSHPPVLKRIARLR